MLRPFFSLLSRTLLSGVLALSLVGPAYAAPVGGVVVAGSGSIAGAGTGAVVVTQGSNRAVIDWHGFDTSVGESVRFVQPNASSLVLNRVLSGSPTQFNGLLQANGHVVVMNGNGVVFGNTARVDVAGLVATTAGISNSDFMTQGSPKFNVPGNGSAAIVNNGLITAKDAGLVGFVAPNVVNNGIITARLGKVALASGDSFTLDLYGDGLVEVKASDALNTALAANTGAISAQGGTVALTAAQARASVDSLVLNAGLIEATSYQNKNGTILLSGAGQNAVANNVTAAKNNGGGRSFTANTGVLNASGLATGQKGGTVRVLGDHVALAKTSVIATSGDAGGGTVLVGGDRLGQGTTPNAKTAVMEKGSVILNQAVTSGNGGKTILWSDGTTDFHGDIIGTGGSVSGNGGFTETSGKQNLKADGFVNLTAAHGTKGQWLLDPNDITIYGNVDPRFVSTDGSVSLGTDLKLWLDASDHSTLFSDTAGTTLVNNGQGVALWKDKSGNHNDALQSNNGSAPLWLANGQDGRPAVRFDGIDDYLNSPLTIGSLGNNLTLNVAVNLASTASAAGVLFWRGSNAHGLDESFVNNGANWGYHWNNDYSSYGWSGGPPTAIGQTQLVSAVFSPANAAFYINGGSPYVNNESNPVPSESTSLIIGSDSALSSRYMNGDISEIAIFARALSQTENTLLSQYQATKLGTALSVPGTGATEVAKATAADGYNVFDAKYLERLSQYADINLQATHDINIDLQNTTMTLATDRSISLNAGHDILNHSAGTIQTSGTGNITFDAGSNIALFRPLNLQATGSGAVTLNAGRNIQLSGGDIVTQGGAITLNADRDGNADGWISVNNNGGLYSHGGDIVMGGGIDPLTGNAHSGDTNAGITFDSAFIDARGITKGGNITLQGQGWDGCSNTCNGIFIANTQIDTSHDGHIAMTGKGGDSFANAGIVSYVMMLTSENGNIDITGMTDSSAGNAGTLSLGGTISTTSGNVNLKTINPAGAAHGFGGSIAVNSGGNITYVGDKLDEAHDWSAAGDIIIRPYTANGTMGIGDGTGALQVSDVSLSNLHAGGALWLGGYGNPGDSGYISNAGTVTIGTATLTNKTIIHGAHDVVFDNSTLTIGGGKSFGVTAQNIAANGQNNIVSANGDINLDASHSLATGRISAGSGNVTLTANDISLAGDISGTGILTLQQKDSGHDVRINTGLDDGSTLYLSTAELAYLKNGWSKINIGNDAAMISVGNSVWHDDVAFRDGNHTTRILGTIQGDGAFDIVKGSLEGGSLTSDGSHVNFNTIDILGGGSIATHGGTISTSGISIRNGAPGNVAISSDGGNIAIGHIDSFGAAAGKNMTINAGTGNVAIAGTVNTDANLAITGNGITLGGIWGGTAALGNVALTAVDSLVLPSITTAAGKTVDVKVTGAAKMLTAGSIVTGANGNIRLTADNMTLNGDLSGTGVLKITTQNQGRALRINSGIDDNTTLHLTTAEQQHFKNGWSQIQVGNVAHRGTVIIGDTTWHDSVVFGSNSDKYLGAITSTGDASLNFDTQDGMYGTVLGNVLTTAGGNVTITSGRFISNGGSINSHSGDVSVNGNIILDGAYGGLTIVSGNGDVSVSGVITTQDAVVANTVFNVNAGTGNAVFNGTINGPIGVDLKAHTLAFGSALGQNARLGAVSLVSATTLSLPSVKATSLVARATNAAADVVVASGAQLNASGTGNALVVAAGRNFINQSGAAALSAVNGRWLVYATDMAHNLRNGLAPNAAALFGKTFAANAPATIGAGSRFLFSSAASDAPVITFTAGNLSKNMGAVNGLLAYIASGALLTGDTLANAFAGAPALTTAVDQTTAVGSYGITIASGSLASLLGYRTAFVDGTYTVTGAQTPPPVPPTPMPTEISKPFFQTSIKQLAQVPQQQMPGDDTPDQTVLAESTVADKNAPPIQSNGKCLYTVSGQNGQSSCGAAN